MGWMRRSSNAEGVLARWWYLCASPYHSGVCITRCHTYWANCSHTTAHPVPTTSPHAWTPHSSPGHTILLRPLATTHVVHAAIAPDESRFAVANAACSAILLFAVYSGLLDPVFDPLFDPVFDPVFDPLFDPVFDDGGGDDDDDDDDVAGVAVVVVDVVVAGVVGHAMRTQSQAGSHQTTVSWGWSMTKEEAEGLRLVLHESTSLARSSAESLRPARV